MSLKNLREQLTIQGIVGEETVLLANIKG